MYHKDAVVQSERTKVLENIAAHSVQLFIGQGQFEDPHKLLVQSKEGSSTCISSDVFVIATGSKPHRSPEIPYDDEFLFDSDTILQMERIPSSLAAIGGGVIGCELSSLVAPMGTPPSPLDAPQRLLPFPA